MSPSLKLKRGFETLERTEKTLRGVRLLEKFTNP
jgi:hypothetical protein